MIITFEKIQYEADHLKKWKNKDFFLSPDELNTANFIQDWLSGKSQYNISTSGSTGKPKQILLEREQMELSAKNTIKALGLIPGTASLVCLNTRYIGGMMMLVRSMVNEMHMVIQEATGNPLANQLTCNIALTAMVPLQLEEILKHRESSQQLKQIDNILLGGAPVDHHLEQKIADLSPVIYHTYGMTETISHVALKKLNHAKSSHFHSVGDVLFKVDQDNRLIIQGSITHHKPLLTNDIVQLHDETAFTWQGRYDNIINSGGIKVVPELVEQEVTDLFIANQISNNFFISKKADRRLGHKVVLVVEGEFDHNKILYLLKENINGYQRPKEVIKVDKFATTETGKINRGQTLQEVDRL